ncbi:acyl-CoA/acyl-ACP dehydrogenase [Lichenihabitans sp. Uapishka_5]|uniref:acyl-CoA dehydrogenase family protein n=1 Tax=Lichenihabitans sp. Uapishka_5 TaxID=3037302 RepID=UPI0029E80960|nr:acyl-CoA dehydrogenase family protein [Lichenihabitans sp. Uapishka_5]MDX7954011.1 acyl-CoA/acyl-ACP dehydrogenase [Lichenihabitans sp. Uapishka_5]
MRELAREVADPRSAQVDRDGAFPAHTVAALRRERLLGLMVPERFGGSGADLRTVTDLCASLAGACGSSAMIYAMHQIKLSSLVMHGQTSDWHCALLRDVAAQQLLIASSTTEAGIGGDLRTSLCAVERDGDRFHFRKEASVISYGRQADVILVTARRSPDAAGSDQVLVALRRADYQLEQRGDWDTLGMRGTCSEGFLLTATGSVEQILPKPFHEIAAQSMLATSHLLWGSVWFGIAADAARRAQVAVKAAMRKAPNTGAPPPGGLRLAGAMRKLGELKTALEAGLDRYAAALRDEDALRSLGFAVEMNNLKLTCSTLAVEIANEALLVTGLAGYKNNTPVSVGRHLRDLLSAPLMIGNDRILANTANLLPMSRFDTSLGSP